MPGSRRAFLAALTADPDGDGMTNLLEHAFGLDPKRPDAGRSAPGMPEVFTARDAETGLTHLGVRFRGRHDADLSPAPVTYAVETAEGEPFRWAPAEGTLTPTPAANSPGQADFVWRSTAPVTPGGRLLVRVRVSAR